MQGSVTAALIGLSVLKFAPVEAPYQKAGEAAYVQSGTAQVVDQAKVAVERKARFTLRQLGVPEKAMVATLVAAKVVRDREVSVQGPEVVSARTQLTAGLDHGTLGITWRF